MWYYNVFKVFLSVPLTTYNRAFKGTIIVISSDLPFKGTIIVISSYLPFKEGHTTITIITFKLFISFILEVKFSKEPLYIKHTTLLKFISYLQYFKRYLESRKLSSWTSRRMYNEKIYYRMKRWYWNHWWFTMNNPFKGGCNRNFKWPSM